MVSVAQTKDINVSNRREYSAALKVKAVFPTFGGQSFFCNFWVLRG